MPTTLQHREIRLEVAEADIRNLAREVDLVEDESTSIDDMRLEDLVPLLVPEALPVRHRQTEIAIEDSTYRFISDTLIPDPHIPGMRLFHFLTFQGVEAFQPCHRDIEALRVFQTLHHIESNDDPVFKAAREWSCSVQAIENLPKAVRWVLVIIYNFACEMLHPTVAKTTLMARKPWLIHWYKVADYFFDRYGISATVPDAEWSEEALSRAGPSFNRRDGMNGIHKNQHSFSSDLSDTGTIIHHHGHGSLPLALRRGGDVFRRLQGDKSTQHCQS